MRKIRILSICILLLGAVGPTSYAQKKSPPKTTKSLNRKPISTGTFSFKSIESEGKDEKELRSIVKGYSILLKETPAGPSKNKILISQISAHLSLAKIYRLKTPQTEAQKKLELRLTQLALKLTKQIIDQNKVDPKLKSYTLYLSGLANINLNKHNEARDNFVYSITLDPDSEIAPAVSLFIGQIYFDEENYEFAIKYYNKFFSKLNNNQRAIALYKTAWSYFNQEKLADAERIFIKLAKQKKKAPLQEDALKDLAYLLTLQRQEQEILDFTATTFPSSPDMQIELLEQVYSFFQLQSGNQKKPLILQKIMSSNISADRKLKVLIANLKGVQKGYASKETYTEFERILKFIKENKITKASESFKSAAIELESEVTTLIRSFGETFSEKTKSPENLSPAYISKQFETLLLFHIENFPESAQIQNSIELLVALYTKNKSYQNLYNLSKWILKKNFPDNIKKLAEENVIASLDELEKRDSKYRPELKAHLADFVKDTSSKKWALVAKRYSKILTDDKEFDKALPLVDKIDSTEKSDESYYRLQWVRFELAQYSNVIQDKREVKDPQLNKDTANILRESYLKSAEANTKDGDFGKYEESILSFLNSNPDITKKNIALRDYFKKLIEKNEFEKVLTFSMTLPIESRFNVETLPLLKRTTGRLIAEGKCKNVLAFLAKDQKPGQYKEFDMDYISCWLSQEQSFDKNQMLFLKKQPAPVRKYVLSTWSFYKPAFAQDFIRTFGAQNKDEQLILFFSFQVEQDAFEPELPPWVKMTLKGVIPTYLLKEPKETDIERIAKAVKFPTAKANEAEKNKLIQKAIEKTREIRPKLVKEISNNSDRVKKRVLTAAIQLEDKISEHILGSPVPKELAEEKQGEYKAQIAELAKEFTDQSAEYKKILNKIEETNLKLVTDDDIKSWSWVGQADVRSKALTGSPIQKQVALDRGLELELLTAPEYYDIKMRNILTHKKNLPLELAISEDLTGAKQTDLLKRIQKGDEK